MPRLRTIRQAIQEIRDSDPNTCITYNFIRNIILQGELPFIQVGKKRLIDMDMLEEFLRHRMKNKTEN